MDSPEASMNIVLYQPEIPQNTGNIGRTCVALSAKLWLVRPMGFRLDSTQVKRAGLDYWEHLDYEICESWIDLCTRLPPTSMWFFSKFATRTYTDARFEEGATLVFGSETSGFPESFHKQYRDRLLSIPMPGPVRSLNLATSVGIVAYEALRQSRPD